MVCKPSLVVPPQYLGLGLHSRGKCGLPHRADHGRNIGGGLHVDLYPAFAAGLGGHWRFATLATLSWLRRMARQSGKAGRGRQAWWGWAKWDGWQGLVAGLVGDGLGGMAGQVMGGGWIFGVKNVLE